LLHIKYKPNPFGESTISAVKSDIKIVLDKSKRLGKTLVGYGKKQKTKNKKQKTKNKKQNTEYNFSKATSMQLMEIRMRLNRENSVLCRRIIGLSILLIITLIGIIFAS
jgi:hypothetical protein